MVDVYSTGAMTQAVNSIKTPGRFLLDRFFRLQQLEDTEEIHFDVEIDDIKIAPFVHPTMKGVVQGSAGFRTDTFKPAYLKPKDQVRPNDPLRRSIGEPLQGNLSPAERESAQVASLLAKHRQQIERRLEWMAANVLISSTITVTGAGYPTQVVDFQRDAALSVALTGASTWGSGGISPVDDLAGWIDLVADKSGAGPDTVVMTTDAWNLFKADAKFKDQIDIRRAADSSAELGFKAGVPGSPQFRGTIGQVQIYTYNDKYTDEAGNTQSLLAAKTVLVVASGAVEGVQAFGAIQDAAAGFQAVPLFSKSWIEQDPPVRWVMTQSAPLVYPRRPNATFRATVA